MRGFRNKIIFLECIVFYVLVVMGFVSGRLAPEEDLDSVDTYIHAESDPYQELPKKVALTFDDGPHPTYTVQLLDGLKKRGVRATFFVIGKHAEEYPELISRMQEEGHLIGNHTYSHLQLKKSNREEFKEELKKTNAIIEEITGEKVQYVRPPYGCWDKDFEEELSMFPILWDVDPVDWRSGNAGYVVQRVIGKVQEGDIVLLHDYYGSSVEAALQIVDVLQKQGYEFVTVEELLME